MKFIVEWAMMARNYIGLNYEAKKMKKLQSKSLKIKRIILG